MFHCVCTDILTRFFDNLTISYTILYLIYIQYTQYTYKYIRVNGFLSARVSVSCDLSSLVILFFYVYIFALPDLYTLTYYILHAAVDARRMMSFNPLPRTYTTDYIYNVPLKCTHNNNNNNNKEESCKMTNSPYKG